jgi:hypothetical protein
MNSSDKVEPPPAMEPQRSGTEAVLARDVGVPFQPPVGNASGIDPFAE